MKTITFPRGPVFGADGKISPNGILLGYEPDTDNLKQWFYDAEHTTLAPNPIQAASDGRIPEVYLGEGKYRIKQYAPASEQSIIPDDMTDFPVGDDWTFICEWICEGENIVKGTKTLSVDYVRELADVAASDAAWVQVMNYSRKGDCFPRWFYHTDVAHTPDGGSVFVARDGGYWVLAIDGQIVDARIFGVAEEEEDVFGNLAQALDYCYRMGKTLYLPAGTYSFTTSGTLHAECPIVFGDAHGDTVLFNTTDGASVVLSVENAYSIPQTTTMCYAANTDFHIDFSSCPVSGTCYAVWNPKEGVQEQRDLGRFKGQSLVISSGRYYGEVSIKTLYVGGNAGLYASNGANYIETLVSTGGTARSSGQSITVGTAYAAALYNDGAKTDEGNFAINNFVLDANVKFVAARTFGRVIEGTGAIDATALITVTDDYTLSLSAFSVMNEFALASVAKNNKGVLDLRGDTVTVSGTTGDWPGEIVKMCNGIMIADTGMVYLPAAQSVVIENASVSTPELVIPSGSALRLDNSTIAPGNGTVSVNNGAAFYANNSHISAARFYCSQPASATVELEHCHIGDDNVTFTNCSLHAIVCEFDKRVIVSGTMGDLIIEECRSNYDGSELPPDGWYFSTAIKFVLDYGQGTYGTVSSTPIPINGKLSVRNNLPHEEDATSDKVFWPETEGKLVRNAITGQNYVEVGQFANHPSILNPFVDGNSTKYFDKVAATATPMFTDYIPTLGVQPSPLIFGVKVWSVNNFDLAYPICVDYTLYKSS